jgi:predicted nucleic acid-binding protein
VRVFLDTNVLLDVLSEREPFWRPAARVWSLAESGRLEAFVSAISYNNCFYIVRKHVGQARAYEALRILRDVFRPVPLTEQVLHQALDGGFSDFEDAIQYFSALQARAEVLLTRNPDDYPKPALSVLSPIEFLAVHPQLAE